MTQAVSLGTKLRSFAWPVWGRSNLAYKIVGGVLLFIALAVHLPVTDVTRQILAEFYNLTLIFLLFTVVGFAPYGTGTPNPNQSTTYPTVMFTVPISTKEFVFLPISIAFGGFACAWLLFVATAILPLGIEYSIEFPLVQAAAFICVTHCLWWFGVWKRSLILMSALSAVTIGFLSFELIFDMMQQLLSPLAKFAAPTSHALISHPTEDLVYSTIALIAILISLAVAPYARHQAHLRRPPVVDASRPRRAANRTPVLPALTNAIQSQTWFEGVRLVYLAPILTSIFGLFFFGMATFMESQMPVDMKYRLVGSQYILSPWMPLPVLLLIGAYFGFLFAPAAPSSASLKGRNHMKEPHVSSFVSIRPITSAQIVAARSLAAARSSLATGAVVALFIALVPIDAGSGSVRTSALVNLASHLTIQNVLLAILVLASLPLLVWCFQAGNVTLDLFGTKGYLATALGFMAPMMYWVFEFMDGSQHKLAFRGGRSFFTDQLMHPEIMRGLIVQVTVVAALCLIGKAALAVRSVSQVRVKRLLSDAQLKRLAALWLGTGAVLLVGYSLLLPPQFVAPGYFALFLALLLPVNRILTQILSVDSNRHR
ncbi:MAG: hypothetical protein P4L46_19560 [Fimbriimonas sp.]|nr:hypothetical protein [Fimbriimonas sp.]